jgi:hypothetical protein
MKKILFSLCAGLVLSGHAQTTLQTSLVACYPLECNAVNSATTGSPLDGTTFSVSCVTGHVAGSNGYSFSGSGSSYISLPGNTTPGLRPQAITFAGWFNVTNMATGQYLVWTDNGCSSNFEAYALAVGNGSFGISKIVGCGSSTRLNANTASSNNTWYHVAFTIDNTSMALYINGSSVGSTAVSSTWAYVTTANVYLGGTAASGLGNTFNAPFTGIMDNLRFYDRILSSAEIAYLAANDPACSSTVSVGSGTSTTSGCCLGNYCSSSLNALTGNYQVSTAGNSFNFTDDAALSDKVNIGYNCNTATIGKLSTFTSKQTNASPSAGVSPYSAAIFGHSGLNTQAVNNVGVMGVGENYGPKILVYGVWGRAIADGGDGVGVRGTSEWINTNSNFGGSFYATRGLHNIGVSGTALAPGGLPAPFSYSVTYPGGANIGVYGGCIGNPANPLNAPPTNNYAAWFDGDVNFNGNVYGSQFAWTSDKRFKNNIKEIGSVTDKIAKLKGYTYEFNTAEFKNRNFPKGEQIGFIAQELKEVFPQLVMDDKQGYLAVNYVGFIPVLLQAIKEQQQQINELKAIVTNGSSNGTNSTGKNTTSIPVNLSDKNAIVLNQNVPNPFAESTVITYNIPSDFTKAQIIFSTTDGVVIRVIDIKEKGAGSLNVFANDLSHGMYSYTLVIDGKTIDTRKMIKE